MTEPLEFSRPIAVERLGDGPTEQAVEASPEECTAVARRLMIPGVRSLACLFKLSRARGGRPGEIVADGHLRAELMRECVVTLDEFATRTDELFRVRFVIEGMIVEDDDPDADDEIPYAGVTIDLGEAAVEQLALTLDPYPRKPGAVLPGEAVDEEEGPFAALARLARRD